MCDTKSVTNLLQTCYKNFEFVTEPKIGRAGAPCYKLVFADFFVTWFCNRYKVTKNQ